MPLNPGASSGEIVIPFTTSGPLLHDSVDIWLRGPAYETTKYPTPWIRLAQDVKTSEGDYTIDGLESGKSYAVCFAWNAAEDPSAELMAGKGCVQTCVAT